jgi:nucleotide-binding universal stress UspA family protein
LGCLAAQPQPATVLLRSFGIGLAGSACIGAFASSSTPGWLDRTVVPSLRVVLDPQVNHAFSEATARLARTVLDQALAQAKERGVSATAETCVSPLVHEAIVQAAERCQCDLIAMASHSRRGLPGVLLGSETQRVLSHSTVPVLVIPARSLGD